MTYSSGGLIQATDYNTFVGNTTAGLNRVWSTGSGDAGWGQTDIATASTGGTVTATQWATLVNNLATSGTQTGTTLTSRTAPVTGNLIAILAHVSTDITSVTTNRGNAIASGAEYGTFTGTTSKTTATGSGQAAWTITFTHTVTFPSANQARYFWNAGGIVRLQYGKSSLGTDADPDWNQLAGWCGSINLTGRVNGAAQTIAGQSYTGTTRLSPGAGGSATVATTTGWYTLTGSPGSPTSIFKIFDTVSPYTTNFIETQATATSSTVLTLVTVWSDDGTATAGANANISGGSPTSSGSTTITGDAPTVLVTYVPPSSATLSNSWGTPTIAASVA